MKISDNVNVKGINYVDSSIYFLDSSVSIYRDSLHNLVFDDANNAPKTLSELISSTGGISQEYVDGSLMHYVLKTGDTISGNLTINSSLFINGNIGVKTNNPLSTLDIGGLCLFNPYLHSGSGGTAYTFDTSATLTVGDYLFELDNKSVPAFYINHQGATYGKSFNAYSSSTNYSALNLNDIKIVTLGGITRLHFNPSVTDGSTVGYIMDTDTSVISSKLLSLRNYGSEKFYVDASGNAYSNSILLGSSVNPVKDILDWSTNKYIPYANPSFGVFDRSDTAPSDSTRLNYNGDFWSTRLYPSYLVRVQAGSAFSQLTTGIFSIGLNSRDYTYFNPALADTSADSTVRYIFDSGTSVLYGKLVSVRNNQTEKFYIDASGVVVAANIRRINKQILVDQATVTWDISVSAVAEVTLTSTRNLSIINSRCGDNGTLIVIQGGTGSYNLTLPTGSLVQGGTYSLSTAVASKDILSFFYDGSNYFWNIGKSYS